MRSIDVDELYKPMEKHHVVKILEDKQANHILNFLMPNTGPFQFVRM